MHRNEAESILLGQVDVLETSSMKAVVEHWSARVPTYDRPRCFHTVVDLYWWRITKLCSRCVTRQATLGVNRTTWLGRVVWRPRRVTAAQSFSGRRIFRGILFCIIVVRQLPSSVTGAVWLGCCGWTSKLGLAVDDRQQGPNVFAQIRLPCETAHASDERLVENISAPNARDRKTPKQYCYYGRLRNDLPSELWQCCLGDMKGIRPVKNWVTVCWWWLYDWSFACLGVPVVKASWVLLQQETMEVTRCFNILAPAYHDCPGNRPLERDHSSMLTSDSRSTPCSLDGQPSLTYYTVA